jgi:hypothetical protein
MTKILLTVFAMLGLTMAGGTLVACNSTASLIRKDALGGRVQLQGAYMPAMADARMLMLEHCDGRFDFEEHGDAVEFHCKAPVKQPLAGGAELALRTDAEER